MSGTELHRRLAAETAMIPWRELQRHFARGVLIVVAADLDLVEVAARVAEDDAGALAAWTEAGRVVRALDDHARRWEAVDQTLLAVVVAPWVLVQEATGAGPH